MIVREHIRDRVNRALAILAIAGAVFCWSTERGPYPFLNGLAVDWLGPQPLLSALCCALLFLWPARWVAGRVLGAGRERDYDEPAGPSTASRTRDPVMFLQAPARREDAPETAAPALGFLHKILRMPLAASVLLLLATGVLWWRGSAHADYLGWSGLDVQVGVLNEDGIVRLEWAGDEAVPPGWRAVSMPPSPRLHGWQSTWEGDLAAATRVGGRYGVAWRVWQTSAGPYKYGDRPRRSLYLSHPFLAGLGAALPLACVGWRIVLGKRRDRDDAEDERR